MDDSASPRSSGPRAVRRFRKLLAAERGYFHGTLALLEEARNRGELLAFLAASLPELKRRVDQAAALHVSTPTGPP